MGQKVSPNGLRYGINKNWNSRWVASDRAEAARWLVEDQKVRLYFMQKHKRAGIEKVEIERTLKSRGLQFDAYVFVAFPGILLGKEGLLEQIERDLKHIVSRKANVKIFVKQVAVPSNSARLVAREIADAIENRVSFRSAQKNAIKKVLAGGALGVKTKVSGRLGGAEIARDEGYSEGVVTLSTLRADIDYALEIAKTTYGVIGVKVWINRGLYFGKGFKPNPEAIVQKNRNFGGRGDDRRNSARNRRQSNNRNERRNTAKANKPETLEKGVI